MGMSHNHTNSNTLQSQSGIHREQSHWTTVWHQGHFGQTSMTPSGKCPLSSQSNKKQPQSDYYCIWKRPSAITQCGKQTNQLSGLQDTLLQWCWLKDKSWQDTGILSRTPRSGAGELFQNVKMKDMLRRRGWDKVMAGACHVPAQVMFLCTSQPSGVCCHTVGD